MPGINEITGADCPQQCRVERESETGEWPLEHKLRKRQQRLLTLCTVRRPESAAPLATDDDEYDSITLRAL
jgi:hypothetical protein